jgi:hypothetical protein
MNWTRTWTLLLVIGGSFASACNGETTETVGSETNWLDPCTADDDCSEGRCLCGVCSKECTEVAGCDDDTMLCASNQSLAHGKLCADVPTAPEGLCLWACEGTTCPTGNHCVEGACVTDSVLPAPQPCAGESECTVIDSANAEPVCAQGVCAVAACDAGFGECNDYHPDGCETNLESGDLSNCGECGAACDEAMPNVATQKCEDFRCQIAECDVGWADCDPSENNGCETDLLTDEGNCGDCDAACDADEECVDGACEPGELSCPEAGLCEVPNGIGSCSGDECLIASCDNGFGDCNADHTDGCETNVASGDVSNCGACGNPCDQDWPNVAELGCANFQCTIVACETGWRHCDSVRTNGCEIDVMSDEASCGDCDEACESDQECVEGTCQ